MVWFIGNKIGCGLKHKITLYLSWEQEEAYKTDKTHSVSNKINLVLWEVKRKKQNKKIRGQDQWLGIRFQKPYEFKKCYLAKIDPKLDWGDWLQEKLS